MPDVPTGDQRPRTLYGGEPPLRDDRPPRDESRRPVVLGIAVAIVAALIGAAIAHVAWPGSSSPTAAQHGLALLPSQGASRGVTSSSQSSTASIAARVAPALVDINTILTDGSQAAGTGMVVTSTGEVITNNHVILGATRISATDIGNGRTYTATVVGYDRADDIAVLRLNNASGLRTVTLGDSSTVSVGQSVVTIGNAGGLGGTPSSAPGTVTALGQSITAGNEVDNTFERLTGLIEIDGQLQPGDSGGPLVDRSGRVVGMDTAASASFSFATSTGQGFAIPVNRVVAIANRIVAGRASDRIHIGETPLMGVVIETLGPRSNSTAGRGVAVMQVVPGSAADGAGITAGDTILSLGGRSVNSSSALVTAKDRYHPGDRVRITWADPYGSTHSATLKLAKGAPD